MPINNITQTISKLPAAGKRGIDVQTLFVTKQEDFQDHLQGTTVTELNTFKDQLNTRIGEINSTATTMNGYADTASAGASTATTKAGEASTSASEALTSRNQAETFKNNASTSASTATTKASEASASALSASTSASTATTKAGEASASASQALTSRNQAETFAQQAKASAESVDVNNLVHRTGAETIAGIKTFSSNIVGNITGNAGTATNASNLGGKAPEYYQQALGFTPIQQGGGAGQLTNKIFIGWQGPFLRCQVDNTDFGTTFPMNIAGSAAYAAAFTTAVGSAPSYACRAWVNFNGAGTVAIRASGNVSSITDNGVGNYTVNFTTAMPDTNYSIAGIVSVSGFGGGVATPLVLAEGLAASNTYSLKTQSAITVFTINNENDTAFDAFSANVSIFG